jgi:hypothetical protein
MDLDAQIESVHFVSQHHYNPQEVLVYLLQFHRTQRRKDLFSTTLLELVLEIE